MKKKNFIIPVDITIEASSYEEAYNKLAYFLNAHIPNEMLWSSTGEYLDDEGLHSGSSSFKME